MRNKRKFVHKGWLLKRLEHLPETATTLEVERVLKISLRTLQRWISDEFFEENNIAIWDDYRWLWNREKLRTWIIALYGERPGLETAQNPGGHAATVSMKESARQELNMPLNYSVRLGREKERGGQ